MKIEQLKSQVLRKRYEADSDARVQEKALTQQQAKLASQTHTEFPIPNVSGTNQVSLTPPISTKTRI